METVRVGGVPPAGFAPHKVGSFKVGEAKVGFVPSASPFGTVTIRQVFRVGPTGVASAQAFGAVTPRSLFVRSVTGIGSAALFGAPVPKGTITRLVGGAGSAQAFGAVTFRTAVSRSVGGVPSAQSFGAISVGGNSAVSVFGIGSAQGFGAATLRTAITCQVAGLTSAQEFGTPSFSILFPPQTVVVAGLLPGGLGAGYFGLEAGDGHLLLEDGSGLLLEALAPAETRFGAVTIVSGGAPQLRPLSGIPSPQIFGTVTLRTAVTCQVSGLGSAQAFGIPSFSALFPPQYVSVPGLTREAGAAWDPSALSGLTVWVDASQLTPGDLPVWPNQGSGGDGIIVGTPLPVVRADALHGQPVVRFKPSEGRVRGTGMVVDGSFDVSVFVFARMVGPGVGRLFTNLYPPYNFLVGTHTTTDEAIYDNGWLGGTAWSLPTAWKLYECVASNAPRVTRLFINGAERGDGIGTSLGHDNRWNLSGYDASGVEETCDCEIAEVVCYDRALTPAERVQVEEYLSAKWVTGDLPAGETLFGTVTTSATSGLQVASVGSAQAFGAVQIGKGGVSRAVSGVGSAQAFGVIDFSGVSKVTPTGLGSAQAFGTIKIAYRFGPTFVPSAQAFGTVSTGSLLVVAVPGFDPGAGVPGPEERMEADITPANTAAGDYTLGFSFTPTADGQITHIRYWAGAAGIHLGSIWSSGGVRLATVWLYPTGPGWFETELATPFDVVAGTTYMVSRWTSTQGSTGYYGYDSAQPSLAPHLTIVQAWYGYGDVFPAITAAGYTYHADVVYRSGGVAPSRFGVPNAKTITAAPVPGLGSAQAFGTPTTHLRTYVSAPGVSSAQSFGTPTTRVSVPVAGIPSAQSFGTAKATQVVKIPGLRHGEIVRHIVGTYKVGQAKVGFTGEVLFGSVRIGLFYAIPGLDSAQQFGTPTAYGGPVWVSVSGVGSAAQMGEPFVYKVTIRPPVEIDLILTPTIPSSISLGRASELVLVLGPTVAGDLLLMPTDEEELLLVPSVEE